MKPSTAFNELKYILDNVRTPGLLNDHPWTSSLVVVQGVLGDKFLSHKAPGYQLISVLSTLFRQMMPSTPPRRGKRLDTCWCQFGMLAAEYFAPFVYGTPYSTSLRDAWGRIDQAIPFFVFGKSGYDLPESEVSRYLLFADDTEPAPNSTLSDWHTKGLQRLADLFLYNEQHLSQKLSQSSPVLHPPGTKVRLRKSKEDIPASNLPTTTNSPKARGQPAKPHKRWGGLALASLLLIVMLLAGAKALQIYREAKIVNGDLEKIQSLLKNKPGIATFGQAGPLLSSSRGHLAVLQSDVEPFLWMGKYLTWVPVYGGDLSQVKPLMTMANELLVTADETTQGITPLWREVYDQEQPPKLSAMAKLLVDAQPHLSAASTALNAAIAARGKLDLEKLSPDVRGLVTDKIDPYLPILQDGLTFAMALPKLVGASASGPQTYLILMQNEDELRATGGFLTDVGTVVVKDGDILSSNFEDSYALDDLTKPYPPAPWPLERYMAAHILLLRDSNWSPDFPTSAALAEFFYAYTRFHSADGIIAVDQHAVQMLLTVLGPINLEDVSYPITSENVIDYMRAAKFDSGNQPYDPNHRKDFIGKLGEAILQRMKSGQGISLEALSKVLLVSFNEKHILVQLDDPLMAGVLAERGWDGAVRPGLGDYLMVIDSNVGFTKSNAVVETKLSYDVDLSNLAVPTADLKIIQTNHAPDNVPCMPLGARPPSLLSYQQDINLCYWDYLRVYKPAGTRLLGATPHAVPGEWVLDGENVPARVDTLNEGIVGVQGFGTLLVVPAGVTLETNFQFSLPSSVILVGSDLRTMTYEFRVQKQAGTEAIPINICVRLPAGAALVNASLPGEFGSGTWCFTTTLRTDVNIKLEFTTSVPIITTQVNNVSTPTYLPQTPLPSRAETPTPTLEPAHALETPIGTGNHFIIHRVLPGESILLLSQHYGTSVDAIELVNYQLPTLLLEGFPIVIPVNDVDVRGFPAFEAYVVEKDMKVEKLAELLSVDLGMLKNYNGLNEGHMLRVGDWVLIPHMRTAAP
jgi:hypothetical protein